MDCVAVDCQNSVTPFIGECWSVPRGQDVGLLNLFKFARPWWCGTYGWNLNETVVSLVVPLSKSASGNSLKVNGQNLVLCVVQLEHGV